MFDVLRFPISVLRRNLRLNLFTILGLEINVEREFEGSFADQKLSLTYFSHYSFYTL